LGCNKVNSRCIFPKSQQMLRSDQVVEHRPRWVVAWLHPLIFGWIFVPETHRPGRSLGPILGSG
jgi:hypothetical protein